MASSKISASAFAHFVSTSGPARYGLASGRVSMSTRRFWDPYQGLRNAMVKGIRTGDPIAAVWAATTAAPRNMRGNWVAVARGWEQVAPAFTSATALPRRTGVWSTRRLEINVTPHLRLTYPDGRKELVWVHVKAEEPSSLEIDLVLWLLGQVCEQLLPGAAPVFVDARRARLVRPGRSLERVTERWLAAEAAGYAELLDQLAPAAA